MENEKKGGKQNKCERWVRRQRERRKEREREEEGEEGDNRCTWHSSHL